MKMPMHPLSKPRFRFSYAAILAALIFLAVLAIILLIPSQKLREVLTDGIYPVVNLLAAGALFYAARRSAPGSRRLSRAWGVLAVAQLCYAIGDVIWFILEGVLNQQPFPSLADGFYLAFYPLFLAGVLALPARRSTRREWSASALDMAVMLVCASLILWNFLVGPLALAGDSDPWLSQALSLAYPVGDLVMFWALLVLLYGRSGEQNRGPLYLLAAGMVVTIVTDCVFSEQSLLGTYVSGGLLDIGWLLGYLLTGLAGMLQATTVETAAERKRSFTAEGGTPRRLEAWLAYFPYLWIIAAYLLLAYSDHADLPMNRDTLVVGVGSVILLVLIRQIIIFVQNTQLYDGLQAAMGNLQRQRVDLERTNKDLKVEIAERQRAEEQLAYDAMHDPLTDLPNRALFMDRLERAIEYNRRRGNYSFSVIFLDLDQFKVVNDSLGHNVGDQLLVSVGQRLNLCLRTSDTVARLGGDEFVLLLEDTPSIDTVQTVAERILEELSLPFQFNGHRAFISASIGIVSSVAGYEQPADILRDADIAMYRAKALGKGRYEIFDANLRTQAMSRLELEDDLRAALERQEFQLHFQPILTLKENQIIGFEALIRWNHPKRGLILPEEFIHIAEETGLIVDIGKWVLQESCTQIKKWQARYPHVPALTINVNISGRQFNQADFVAQIERVLRATGLDPKSLVLEITETALIDNAEAAGVVFNRLEELGIQLQINDFGTGYSSLGYLKHYPIHTIKIDRSFIQDLGVSSKNTELVRTIVAMARDLGMEAIAEGVETNQQLHDLKEYGCTYMQGFLFSKPLDDARMEQLLDERREKQGIADLNR